MEQGHCAWARHNSIFPSPPPSHHFQGAREALYLAWLSCICSAIPRSCPGASSAPPSSPGLRGTSQPLCVNTFGDHGGGGRVGRKGVWGQGLRPSFGEIPFLLPSLRFLLCSLHSCLGGGGPRMAGEDIFFALIASEKRPSGRANFGGSAFSCDQFDCKSWY